MARKGVPESDNPGPRLGLRARFGVEPRKSIERGFWRGFCCKRQLEAAYNGLRFPRRPPPGTMEC